MPKVRVLPSDVIAKIAAGEVVDRPASVVKELLENSLDAGASRVEVHLVSGGKTLIQVKDNGVGIAREDMESLFLRHATSKIRSDHDLENILSLGFRGEALYSVAAVSELTMRSRQQGSNEAWEVKVRGGKREEPAPIAMPSWGTDIRVEEVFFNTPARKKFLKSDASELDHVINVFLPYALLYPAKHFVLVNNGRSIYDLPPVADGASRCERALALEAEHIIVLDPAREGDVCVSGLLGDMNIQRSRRDMQFVFVNGRPVQSKSLLFHLNNVYRLVMPEGVHPFFVFCLDVPPGEVDVNIHPSKREVRIKDEAQIGRLIRRAVEQALMTKGGSKEVKTEIFTVVPRTDLKEEGVPASKLLFGPGQHRSELASVPTAMNGVSRELPVKPEDFFAFSEKLAVQRGEGITERLSRARFIGTFRQKYHLFEDGEALFVIDQHAAQERILFELFTRHMAAGSMEVERLLTPVVVRLSRRDYLIWEQARQALDELGFESSLMSDEAVAVQTCPRLIKYPEKVFRSLLSEEVKVFANRDILARRACRASVMSGDRMQADEAREQLRSLLTCTDPFTCPHGRPVFIELKESFLDKQFLRG